MKLFIKNMVCNRCIAVVKNEFAQLGYAPASVAMGEVTLPKDITKEEHDTIDAALKAHGFELIDDKKSATIEKIKTVIIDQVHHVNDRLKVNYSTLISAKLGKDYSYLSNLFSEVEGITIEQYIILQKIEKVKELLVYDELSLSQIADEMGYSSVAHLSNQFKKVTGLTPSHFKSVRENKRISLDSVKPQNDVNHSHNDVNEKG
jgi:AraC-like DNA-binding protein